MIANRMIPHPASNRFPSAARFVGLVVLEMCCCTSHQTPGSLPKVNIVPDILLCDSLLNLNCSASGAVGTVPLYLPVGKGFALTRTDFVDTPPGIHLPSPSLTIVTNLFSRVVGNMTVDECPVFVYQFDFVERPTF